MADILRLCNSKLRENAHCHTNSYFTVFHDSELYYKCIRSSPNLSLLRINLGGFWDKM